MTLGKPSSCFEKTESKKTIYEIDKAIVEDIQKNYYLNSYYIGV